MRFACWVTKVTDTHSEHVTLIVFPLQQWLRERGSVLRCTYIACLVEPVSLTHICYRTPTPSAVSDMLNYDTYNCDESSSPFSVLHMQRAVVIAPLFPSERM